MRWRPPAPPGRHGLLDATECANSCPQVTGLGAFAGPATIDEDCLYLNVFATGKPFFGGLKTVIVWIHGGGNVDGKPLTMTEASSPRAAPWRSHGGGLDQLSPGPARPEVTVPRAGLTRP
ncbi:MAG: carboxylesterase family protein [Methyloceanibacter sp.]